MSEAFQLFLDVHLGGKVNSKYNMLPVLKFVALSESRWKRGLWLISCFMVKMTKGKAYLKSEIL